MYEYRPWLALWLAIFYPKYSVDRATAAMGVQKSQKRRGETWKRQDVR